MKLKGKVALVTGSAKRVGRAIALSLARKGVHVAIHYRTSPKEANSVVSEARKYGVKARAIKADLSNVSEVENLVSETLKVFGRLDILVNSASLYGKHLLEQVSESHWDAHLDTNLKGPFFLAQAAAQAMKKQKAGKIVNIIDSDVAKPYKHYLPYLVSKAGMVGLTHCLAIELAPEIQVNGISPGPVLMQKDWGPKTIQAILKVTPLKRIGSPTDIANAVLFCLEGTDFMTGAIIPVDGGQHIE